MVEESSSAEEAKEQTVDTSEEAKEQTVDTSGASRVVPPPGGSDLAAQLQRQLQVTQNVDNPFQLPAPRQNQTSGATSDNDATISTANPSVPSLPSRETAVASASHQEQDTDISGALLQQELIDIDPSDDPFMNSPLTTENLADTFESAVGHTDDQPTSTSLPVAPTPAARQASQEPPPIPPEFQPNWGNSPRPGSYVRDVSYPDTEAGQQAFLDNTIAESGRDGADVLDQFGGGLVNFDETAEAPSSTETPRPPPNSDNSTSN